jgi:hypothetical protein
LKLSRRPQHVGSIRMLLVWGANRARLLPVPASEGIDRHVDRHHENAITADVRNDDGDWTPPGNGVERQQQRKVHGADGNEKVPPDRERLPQEAQREQR